MVPENKEVVELYNKFLYEENEKQIQSNRKGRLIYFHLAAYATAEHGTRIWSLYRRKHSQDDAVMKEVARFRDENPGPRYLSFTSLVDEYSSFGVSCYALIPGERFTLGKDHEIDYEGLQQQVIQQVLLEGIDRILEREECDLNSLVRFVLHK